MRADRPSRSALGVAWAVLVAARDQRYAGLLPAALVDATRRMLAAAPRVKPRHLRRLRSRWFLAFARRAERLSAPGHHLYLALRKRFVHDEALAALEAGAAQVLVVGAGMDVLGLRFAPAYPDVTFVEVDHPASQRVKRQALDALGGPSPNHHLLPADLVSGPPLDRVLAACDAWRPGAPTFVVSEGVLMYLPADAVARVRDALRRTVGPGSRWALTYVTLGPDGRVDLGRGSWLKRVGMRLMGEPFHWGVRHDDLSPFLEAGGFHPLGPPERSDLRARYLAPAGLEEEPLSSLEYLALAEG